mmetsp:Transcript_14550/g.45744  ORF Transcript_14550/g.45744 Transcript_14550/m.45744 type:complete len:398 (+) Transcript_14550:199-1392(+)
MQLAELYMLQAEQRHLDKKGLSEKELLAPWDGDGSRWHATGRPRPTPLGCEAASEAAFSRRGLFLRPSTDKRAEELLDQCGACALNQKGLKDATDFTLGQDNFCIALLEGGWEVYGVFDGHGPGGHWPSFRAARSLPLFLQRGACAAMIRQGRLDAALIWAFEQVQQDLIQAAWPPGQPKPTCSLPFAGCTGVCMLRHPSKRSLWVAHVGDSRAVLVAPGLGAARETEDHKPSVPSERLRIEQNGCEVRQQTFEDGLSEDRIYIKGRPYPGIMMTRSLGDLLVKDKGVIATPEVTEWPLDSCEGGVVALASDGLWEFVSSGEVAELILGCRAQGQGLDAVAERLAANAQALWEEKEPGYCDDITVLLLALDGPGLRPVRRTGPPKPETSCASFCSVQ